MGSGLNIVRQKFIELRIDKVSIRVLFEPLSSLDVASSHLESVLSILAEKLVSRVANRLSIGERKWHSLLNTNEIYVVSR
jgi:hypothetical protein